MLSAHRLTKKYGNFTALRDMDLEVKAGEIYCLLGANGAGKTTTINLFLNFISPSSGKALINGHDTHHQDSKKHVAYIPENVSLYGNLTGLENLQFFTGLGDRQLNKGEAEEILVSVGLQSRAVHERVSNFSKGMRQKVGIAIAKAKQADNLLLDEPTSGLDPQASNDFTRLLQNLRSQNVAILMTTHDLFRAKETATHIGIMKEGVLEHSLKCNEITLKQLEELYLETMRVDV